MRFLLWILAAAALIFSVDALLEVTRIEGSTTATVMQQIAARQHLQTGVLALFVAIGAAAIVSAVDRACRLRQAEHRETLTALQHTRGSVEPPLATAPVAKATRDFGIVGGFVAVTVIGMQIWGMAPALADYGGRLDVYERRINAGLGELQSPLRLRGRKCGEQIARSCQFEIGPHSAILATGADKRNLNNVTAIFDMSEASERLNFVVIVGALALALEPEAARGGALNGFLPMVTQTVDDNKTRSMMIGRSKFSVALLLGRLVVTAERPPA